MRRDVFFLFGWRIFAVGAVGDLLLLFLRGTLWGLLLRGLFLAELWGACVWWIVWFSASLRRSSRPRQLRSQRHWRQRRLEIHLCESVLLPFSEPQVWA